MTVRSVLTESFDATKRQDPVLREDVMLLLECGPEVLAYSERPADGHARQRKTPEGSR